jgi:hypothetical protein
MEGYARQKVPGGKLVYVRLTLLPNGTISKAEILGDFFIHPESAIFDMERCVISLNINDSKDVFKEKLSKAVADSGAELVGITPEAIADTIKSAAVR